jgi:lysozyme
MIKRWSLAITLLSLLILVVYTHRELVRDIFFDLLEERYLAENLSSVTSFGVKAPAGYEIYGIDVSHHQGRIDWKRVKAMKSDGDSISFVFIKASEGRRHHDRKFDSNWRHVSRLKLIKGAYHYYVPHVNSNLQANNFISKVNLSPGDLPPVLDIEDESIYGSDNLMTGLLNWLKIIEAHYKVKPIIYTSASFFQRHLNKPAFKQYPIWVAHYHQNRPRVKHERWSFWQYSDRGEVDGIREKVDLNVYQGSMEDLEKMLIKNK